LDDLGTVVAVAAAPLDLTKGSPATGEPAWAAYIGSLAEWRARDRLGLSDPHLESLRRTSVSAQTKTAWEWAVRWISDVPQDPLEWLEWLLPVWDAHQLGYAATHFGLPAAFESTADQNLRSLVQLAQEFRAADEPGVDFSHRTKTYIVTEPFWETLVPVELPEVAVSVASALGPLDAMSERPAHLGESNLWLSARLARAAAIPESVTDEFVAAFEPIFQERVRGASVYPHAYFTVARRAISALPHDNRPVLLEAQARRMMCGEELARPKPADWFHLHAREFGRSFNHCFQLLQSTSSSPAVVNLFPALVAAFKGASLCRLAAGAAPRSELVAMGEVVVNRIEAAADDPELEREFRARLYNSAADLGVTVDIVSRCSAAALGSSRTDPGRLVHLGELAAEAYRLRSDKAVWPFPNHERALVNRITQSQIAAVTLLASDDGLDTYRRALEELRSATDAAAIYGVEHTVPGYPAAEHFSRQLALAVAGHWQDEALYSCCWNLVGAEAADSVERNVLADELVTTVRPIRLDVVEGVEQFVATTLRFAPPTYRLGLAAARGFARRWTSERSREHGTLLLLFT